MTPTVFVRESIQAVGHTFVEALILVVIVGVGLPPNMEGVHHSSFGTSGVADWNVFDHAGAGVFA